MKIFDHKNGYIGEEVDPLSISFLMILLAFFFLGMAVGMLL